MSNDDKNTSDLRRLLQEKLANSEAAPDAWNVPSGGVWTGISDELTAAKPVFHDKRKPLWPWVAIGILAALLLFRECSHQQALGQMEQEMQQLQRDCEEKLSKRRNTSPEGNNGLAQLPMGASPVTYHDILQDDLLLKQQLNRSKIAADNPTSHQPFYQQSTQKLTEPPALSVIQNAKLQPLVEFEQPLEVKAPDLLPGPDLRPFVVKQKAISLPDAANIPVSQKPGIGLIASLYSGIALTGNKLSGEKPAIIHNQKALLAWQTGFGLEAVINRNWSVLTGVSYNTSRIETDYSLAVPFTHNGEFQHDDGNFDNQYNHSLPSSLGNYPLQMVLTRASDATIHEGEVMNLELRIHQKTEFISVPLQLRYAFGINKWQMGLRAGALANHVIGVESETPDLVSLHGAIHQRHTSIGAPKLADLEKWTFDYAVGLDFRHQLTPRLGLSTQTNFQMAATPIYRDDAVKNYLNAIGLNLGIHYALR